MKLLQITVLVTLTGSGLLAAETAVFPKLVDGAEYERRLGIWKKTIEKDKQSAKLADYPSVGDRVSTLSDEGTFVGAGIPLNSIIVDWGNLKSWGGFTPRPVLETAREIEYVDPDGKLQSAQIEGGPTGAKFSRHYRLGVAYRRGEVGVLDASWADDIAVACASVVSDWDLSKTALHLALEKGYPEDELTDWFRCVFARFSENGPDDEMEQFLARFETGPIPWPLIPPLHDVLVASGRIDFMQRIEHDAESGGVFDSDTIEQFLKWTDGETKWPEEKLLSRAIANRGESLNGLFNSENDITEEDLQNHFGREFSWRTRPGQYFGLTYNSDVEKGGGGGKIPQNFHYRISLTLFATGLHPRWGTSFRVGFSNVFEDVNSAPLNTRFAMSGMPLSFRRLFVSLDKSYGVTSAATSANSLPGSLTKRARSFNISFIDDPVLPENFEKSFEANREKYTEIPAPIQIDLIRYNHEVGVFINGQCWLHQPTDPDPDRDLEFRLHSVGLEGYLHEQDIWEILD